MSKKYKDDYTFKKIQKEDGSIGEQIVYQGSLYLNDLSPVFKKRLTVSGFTVSFLTMGMFFVSGFLDNGGSRCLYVMLPYICIFLPAVYFILSAFGVWQAPAQLTREQFDKSFGRMQRMPKIIAVLSVLSVLCDGVFILLNQENIFWENELPFSFFLLVTAVMNLFFLKFNKNSFECIKIQE